MPALSWRSWALVAGPTGLAVLALASCASETPAVPAETAPATFTAVYAMMFPASTNGKCNFCHGLPANNVSNGNLSMGTDKAVAYAALVAKVSSSTACNGRPLVVAGHPETSLLLAKLFEDVDCGSRMPLGGNLFSDEQRQMVRGWIAAGAKDN